MHHKLVLGSQVSTSPSAGRPRAPPDVTFEDVMEDVRNAVGNLAEAETFGI